MASMRWFVCAWLVGVGGMYAHGGMCGFGHMGLWWLCIYGLALMTFPLKEGFCAVLASGVAAMLVPWVPSAVPLCSVPVALMVSKDLPAAKVKLSSALVILYASLPWKNADLLIENSIVSVCVFMLLLRWLNVRSLPLYVATTLFLLRIPMPEWLFGHALCALGLGIVLLLWALQEKRVVACTFSAVLHYGIILCSNPPGESLFEMLRAALIFDCACAFLADIFLNHRIAGKAWTVSYAALILISMGLGWMPLACVVSNSVTQHMIQVVNVACFGVAHGAVLSRLQYHQGGVVFKYAKHGPVLIILTTFLGSALWWFGRIWWCHVVWSWPLVATMAFYVSAVCVGSQWKGKMNLPWRFPVITNHWLRVSSGVSHGHFPDYFVRNVFGHLGWIWLMILCVCWVRG